MRGSACLHLVAAPPVVVVAAAAVLAAAVVTLVGTIISSRLSRAISTILATCLIFGCDEIKKKKISLLL